MLGLTMSRRFRTLMSYGLIGYMAVFVLANTATALSGRQSVAGLVAKVSVAMLLLAAGLYLLRIRKTVRARIDVHTALKRMCAALTREGAAYLAVDAPNGIAVHVERTRKLLFANYTVAVGERDEDWVYDPATFRNVHFMTATIYALSPGVADVRKVTEAAAAHGEDDLTLMDAPATRSGIREAFEIVRAPRELNFATTDELRTVLAVLDRAVPHPGPTEEKP